MATTTQTVRDIATKNPEAIRVFEKYGIDYCCGGRVPLAEACATKGLNLDDVIASLDAATALSAPEEKDWTKESLASLAEFIVDTHHTYVTRTQLPSCAYSSPARYSANSAAAPSAAPPVYNIVVLAGFVVTFVTAFRASSGYCGAVTDHSTFRSNLPQWKNTMKNWTCARWNAFSAIRWCLRNSMRWR